METGEEMLAPSLQALPAVTSYLLPAANTLLFKVFMISVMENYERFHHSEDTTKNCNHVLGGVAGLLAVASFTL